MKKEKTVELLARFMEGMTTVEEEEVLADFFRNATDDDKPAGMPYDDWAAYREMFRQFDDGFHEKREVQKKQHDKSTMVLYVGSCRGGMFCHGIHIGFRKQQSVALAD